MTTAIIAAPAGARTGLQIRKQITVIENGALVWRDAEDTAALAGGQSTIVKIANSHQRYVVELTPAAVPRPTLVDKVKRLAAPWRLRPAESA